MLQIEHLHVVPILLLVESCYASYCSAVVHGEHVEVVLAVLFALCGFLFRLGSL